MSEMNKGAKGGTIISMGGSIIFTHLIVFIYLVQVLAVEKESKAREGMKIMGLDDSTYYLGNFIFFMIFALYNATVISLMLYFLILKNTSLLIIFFLCLVYSLTNFGTAWILVSLSPSSRGSTLISILYQLLSFFLA
jgi:hypothetical protein